MKLCVGCKHYSFLQEFKKGVFHAPRHLCTRNVREEVSLVTGVTEKVGNSMSCSFQRLHINASTIGIVCGPEGKFWKKRND